MLTWLGYAGFLMLTDGFFLGLGVVLIACVPVANFLLVAALTAAWAIVLLVLRLLMRLTSWLLLTLAGRWRERLESSEATPLPPSATPGTRHERS